MMYNALFVNEIAENGKYEVYKTKKHNDGEKCFGGGWFLVSVHLPTGVVDNHYELKYIRLSDPIIFLLNGEEAYEAYPELRREGRFSNGYVVHCVEFK